MSKDVEVRTHYFEEDPEYLSDYAEVSLHVDGVEVARYGDAGHDRGREKAEGFVTGLTHAWGEGSMQVRHTQVADYA